MGDYLTRFINDSIGMEARPTVLGRVMAYKFAVAAVDALEVGQTNSIMGFEDGGRLKLVGEIEGVGSSIGLPMGDGCGSAKHFT